MPDKIRPPKASFHDLIDWFSKLFGPVGAVIAVMYGKLFKLMPEKQGEFNSFVADELNSNRENITQILSDLCESHKDSYQGRNSNGTFVIKQSGFVEFETKLTIGPEEQVIELTPPIQLDSGCFESITIYGGEFERVQLSP